MSKTVIIYENENRSKKSKQNLNSDQKLHRNEIWLSIIHPKECNLIYQNFTANMTKLLLKFGQNVKFNFLWEQWYVMSSNLKVHDLYSCDFSVEMALKSHRNHSVGI